LLLAVLYGQADAARVSEDSQDSGDLDFYHLDGIWEAPDGQGLAQQQPLPLPSPTTSPPPATSPPPGATPEDTMEADPQPGEEGPDSESGEDDDFSMGDLPTIETVELTPDMAKRALDAYVLLSEKYKDAELENYENLQDFVDQAPQGKAFEADTKAAGFASVNDWNTAITTISFAYANIIDDQTADIRQQIEEIKTDTEMAQDMRERMIVALSAMIPSDNNRKIVEDLMKDPVYGEKIKQLETEEE
jgi:hypothetical protein